MRRAVIDTNVLISFLEKGHPVAQLLSGFDRLVVPAPVDAEFRAGLNLSTKSGRAKSTLLDELLADESVEYVSLGRSESRKYAEIFKYLKGQGTPIPSNDIWIASVALLRDATLVTMDEHFRRIPLLDIINL